MTTVAEIVRAAIPDADDAIVERVLWGRTPFPIGAVTARGIYRAASGLRRAEQKSVRLCDCCHRIAQAGDWTCASCSEALRRSA